MADNSSVSMASAIPAAPGRILWDWRGEPHARRGSLFREQNVMPTGGGIVNARERKALLDLAKRFAAAGDQALEFEGEVKPPR